MFANALMYKTRNKVGVVIHIYNPNMWEAKTERC